MCRSIVETQLKYAAFTIAKTKDVYKEIKLRLQQADKVTKETYNRHVKNVFLDASRDDFYQTFCTFLLEVGQAVCSFYHFARLSFIERLEWDLDVSKDKLKTVTSALEGVREQASHARKDVLVDSYQEATDFFANLAESASNMALQPTTAGPLSKTLDGFFDLVNDLNDKVADEINVLLQAPANKVEEVYAVTAAAFSELDFCISDLSRIIADERTRISRIDLAPIFLREFQTAQDQAQVTLADDEDDYENSSSKRLEDLSKAGIFITPSQRKLAQVIDAANVGLREITREAVSQSLDDDRVRAAKGKISSALGMLPESTESALNDRNKRMADAAARAKHGLLERVKELEKLQASLPAGSSAASFYDEQLRQIAQAATADISPQNDPDLFGDERTALLRSHLQDRAANGAGANPSKDGINSASEATKKEILAYLQALDERMAKEKAMIGQAVQGLDAAAKGIARDLNDADSAARLLAVADQVGGLVDSVDSVIPGATALRSSMNTKHNTSNVVRSSVSAQGVSVTRGVRSANVHGRQLTPLEIALADLSNAIADVKKSDPENKQQLASAARGTRKPLSDVAREVVPVISNEPALARLAAASAEEAMNKRNADLQAQRDELAALSKLVSKDPNGDYSKQLDEAIARAERSLEGTINAYSASANPNIFGGDDGAALRGELRNDVERVALLKDDKGDALSRAQALDDALLDAQSAINAFRGTIPSSVQRSEDLAKALQTMLPAALLANASDVEDAATDGRDRQAMDDAIAETDALAELVQGLVQDAARPIGLQEIYDHLNQSGRQASRYEEDHVIRLAASGAHPSAVDLARAIALSRGVLAESSKSRDMSMVPSTLLMTEESALKLLDDEKRAVDGDVAAIKKDLTSREQELAKLSAKLASKGQAINAEDLAALESEFQEILDESGSNVADERNPNILRTADAARLRVNMTRLGETPEGVTADLKGIQQLHDRIEGSRAALANFSSTLDGAGEEAKRMADEQKKNLSAVFDAVVRKVANGSSDPGQFDSSLDSANGALDAAEALLMQHGSGSGRPVADFAALEQALRDVNVDDESSSASFVRSSSSGALLGASANMQTLASLIEDARKTASAMGSAAAKDPKVNVKKAVGATSVPLSEIANVVSAILADEALSRDKVLAKSERARRRDDLRNCEEDLRELLAKRLHDPDSSLLDEAERKRIEEIIARLPPELRPKNAPKTLGDARDLAAAIHEALAQLNKDLLDDAALSDLEKNLPDALRACGDKIAMLGAAHDGRQTGDQTSDLLNELARANGLLNAAAGLLPAKKGSKTDLFSARNSMLTVSKVSGAKAAGVTIVRSSSAQSGTAPASVIEPASLSSLADNISAALSVLRCAKKFLDKKDAKGTSGEIVKADPSVVKSAKLVEEIFRNEPKSLMDAAAETKAAIEPCINEMAQAASAAEKIGSDGAAATKVRKDIAGIAARALVAVNKGSSDPNVSYPPDRRRIEAVLRTAAQPDLSKPTDGAAIQQEATDLQTKLAAYGEDVSKNADLNARRARELGEEVPPMILDFNKSLQKAGSDLAAQGPTAERVAETDEAIDRVIDILNAAGKIIPSNTQSGSLEDVEASIAALRAANNKGGLESQHGFASKLAQEHRESGSVPTDSEIALAKAADSTQHALDELARAAAAGVGGHTIAALAKNVTNSAARMPAPVCSTAAKRKTDMLPSKRRAVVLAEEVEGEVQRVKDVVRTLRNKIPDSKAAVASAETEDAAGPARRRFRAALLAMTDDVEKDPHFLSSVMSAQLRSFLKQKLGMLDDAKDDNSPEALAELEKMAAETEAALAEYRGDADRAGNLAASDADALARDLPQKIREANDELTIAADEVARKGPGSGRAEHMLSVMDRMGKLAGAAGNLSVKGAGASSTLEAAKRVMHEANALTVHASVIDRRTGRIRPTYVQQLQDAIDRGAVATDKHHQVARTADKADSSIDNVLGALSAGGLAKAVNNAKPAILEAGQALAEALKEEADMTKDVAERTKEVLAKNDAALACSADGLDKLLRAVKTSGQPSAADRSALAEHRDVLLAGTNGVVNAVALEVAPHFFNNPRTENLRSTLNKQADDAAARVNAPAESAAEIEAEIRQLLDQNAAARDAIAAYQQGIDDSAAKSEAVLRKFAEALPPVARQVNDTFIVAASDVVTKGAGEGREERLLGAADQVKALVDTAAWVLPLGGMKPDTEAMQNHLKQMVGDPKNAPFPETSEEMHLKAFKRHQGTPIEQTAQNLAKQVDRSGLAIDGLQAFLRNKDGFTPRELQDAIGTVIPVLDDVGTAAGDAAGALPARLDKDAERSAASLRSALKELDDLEKKVKHLRGKRIPLTPAEVKDVAEYRLKFREVAQRAVDATKNKDLFDDIQSDALRQFLNRQKRAGATPRNAAEAALELEKIDDLAREARRLANEVHDGLPSRVAEKQRAARDLERDLPRALREAALEVKSNARLVAEFGPGAGRLDKLKASADRLASLNGAARSLLPHVFVPAGGISKAANAVNRFDQQKTGRAPVFKRNVGAGLEEVARKHRLRPIPEHHRLALGIDNAQSALDVVATALLDKDDAPGAVRATKEAEPAITEVSVAMAESLKKAAAEVSTQAQLAKKGMYEQQGKLRSLERDLRSLEVGVGVIPDLASLGPFRRRFREGTRLALNHVNSTPFDDVKSAKLRALLNQMQAPTQPNSNPHLAAADLLCDIATVQSQMKDYVSSIDKTAETTAQNLRELAIELPKAVRTTYGRLATSASAQRAQNLDPSVQQNMIRVRDTLAGLLDSSADFLPSADVRRNPADAIQALKKAGFTISAEQGIAAQYSKFALRNGVGAPEGVAMSVAFESDGVKSLVKEASSTAGGDGNAAMLPPVVASLSSSGSALSESVSNLLANEPRRLREVADQCKSELRDLDKEMRAALSAPNTKPSEVERLAQRVIDTLKADRHASLLSSDAPAMVRQVAAQVLRDIKANPKSTTEQLSKLLNQVTLCPSGLDDAVADNVRLSKELLSELPPALRAANASVSSACDNIVRAGQVTPQLKSKLDESAARMELLADAASLLVPSAVVADADSGMGAALSSVATARPTTAPGASSASLDDFMRTMFDKVLQPPVRASSGPAAASAPTTTPSTSKTGVVRQIPPGISTSAKPTLQSTWKGKAGWSLEALRDPQEAPTSPTTTKHDAYVKFAALAEHSKELELPSVPASQTARAKNVWSEIAVLKTNRGMDGKILAPANGSMNHLVNYLTQPLDGQASLDDQDLQRYFLLAMDPICTPEMLIEKMIERFEGPKKAFVSDYERLLVAKVQKRVISFIKQYIIARGATDLATRPQLVEQLVKFAKGPVSTASPLLGKDLGQFIDNHVVSEAFAASKARAAAPPRDVYAEEAKQATGELPFESTLAYFSPHDVANQLTLADADALRGIAMTDLVHGAWTTPSKTPSLMLFLKHAAKVSEWTCCCLLNEPDARRARKIAANMVGLVSQLLQLNNFHSANAVLTGLRSGPVSQLPVMSEFSEKISQLNETLQASAKAVHAGVPHIPLMPNIMSGLLAAEAASAMTGPVQTSVERVDWQYYQAVALILTQFVDAQRSCVFRVQPTRLRASLLKSVASCKLSPATAQSAPEAEGGIATMNAALARLRIK